MPTDTKQKTSEERGKTPSQILAELVKMNKEMLSPWQKGVNKKLEEAGAIHAEEFMQRGGDPREIARMADLDPKKVLSGLFNEDSQAQPVSPMQQLQQPNGGVNAQQSQPIEQTNQPKQDEGMGFLKKLLISVGSGMATAGGHGEIVKSLLDAAQQKNQSLSPQQVATKVSQANEALSAQGLEGYSAGITGSGDITASRSASYGAITTPEEVQDVAKGVIEGITPPDLKEISSFRDRSKITAALAKQGYDLTKAEKDWRAANKFYASMNSTQQIRLRQAINSVSGSLGNLEKLNEEYSRLGFTPANKAQLIANSKGVGKQAVLATEYLTSLGVIQDELSQVFMGGNSPTEKFLEQAQNIVRSEFTFPQLQGVIKQLKINLKYRLNSINQAEPYTPSNKTAEESIAINQNNEVPTVGQKFNGETVRKVTRIK